MAAELRDCLAWRNDNLPLSTTSNEAAKLYDSVVTQMFTRVEDKEVGSIPVAVTKMMEADPDFVLGNAFVVGGLVMSQNSTTRLNTGLAEKVNNLVQLASREGVLPREKLHCKAVHQWSLGKYIEACQTWEEIVFNHPNDLVALHMQYFGYFHTGQSQLLRDSIGRVVQNYDKKHKFYGPLKSLQAFGFVENNMFDLAENAAREALHLNPKDTWGIHTISHCYEMTGRATEGSKFLLENEKNWSPEYNPGVMLGCHNFWHWGLFHLELGDHEKVLEIYDHQVGSSCKKTGSMLDIDDAASLLLRLEFDGVNVGNRWEDIREVCRPHIDDHNSIFSDLHFMMAFLGCQQKDDNLVEQLLSSAESFYQNGHECLYRDLYGKMGKPMLNGLVAYKQGDFESAVEFLAPHKYDYVHLGYSNAQRDVFLQLLIMSCLQSPNQHHRLMARAFINEWKALRSSSSLLDRMHAKFLSDHEISPH